MSNLRTETSPLEEIGMTGSPIRDVLRKVMDTFLTISAIFPQEQNSPSTETLFSLFPRESRFIDFGIEFNRNIQFDSKMLAQNIFDFMQVNKELFHWGDEEIAKRCSIVIDSETQQPKNEFPLFDNQRDNEAVPTIVLLDDVIDEIIPKKYLARYPTAKLFIYSTPQGLTISADHSFTGPEGLKLINTLLDCTVSNQLNTPKIQQSDRKSMNISTEYKGRFSLVFDNLFEKEPNSTIFVMTHNAGDPIPTPIPPDQIANRKLIFDTQPTEQPVSKIVDGLRLANFPTILKQIIYTVASIAPKSVVPEISGLVSIVPQIELPPEKYEIIKSLWINIHMFPHNWGFPSIFGISLTDGERRRQFMSITGNKKEMLEEYQQKLLENN